MCKQSTNALIGHITLSSFIVVLIGMGMVGVWFGDSDELPHCQTHFRVAMWYKEVENECWGSHSMSWEEICDQEDLVDSDKRPHGCAMWRPSLTLHIVSFVLIICGISTAGAQACGCCCQGAKTNLHCSFGFTVSCIVNMLAGFLMFTSAKDDLDGSRQEYGYAWGWIASLMAILLLVGTLAFASKATFCDAVPLQADANAVVSPGPVVVVGKPVFDNN
mmetsp:Transcript_62303/g.115635  ORF Transcript_62303/g.115635 Transcript_62303/m.115635 type:complete len:219 (-) Transcript_62303:166-822(-)